MLSTDSAGNKSFTISSFPACIKPIIEFDKASEVCSNTLLLLPPPKASNIAWNLFGIVFKLFSYSLNASIFSKILDVVSSMPL